MTAILLANQAGCVKYILPKDPKHHLAGGRGRVDRSALPTGIILTVLFEDVGDAGNKTRITLRIQHPTPEEKKKHEDIGVVAGWNSSLDCLEELLEQMK